MSENSAILFSPNLPTQGSGQDVSMMNLNVSWLICNSDVNLCVCNVTLHSCYDVFRGVTHTLALLLFSSRI